MEVKETPIATAGMLIRRPVEEVYEAFIDPAITSRFWFTHGSGRLDAGREVRWEWRMYEVSTTVRVQALVRNREIVIEWSDPPTTVVWTFIPMPEGATFVDIRNYGFSGTADQRVRDALDSTGGFSLVLAGAKAWLEHGLELGLVRDRHPKGLPES
ncbi:SRPBCC family protein [Mesorhizobium sp. BAC0120]|uniref:SRPBCC family protein n=1 Tax=Mesorhizobium sp. BAC0120 TaxID=3090670 RepID=UPI00298C7B1D|nr:SRPBCC family protein [Mesorhizobium sp. BAC0120]MDW6021939.1 SRPBCC family protein [Mesorhizobium sp. BAC0120]